MPWLMGKNEQVSNVNAATSGLQNRAIGALGDIGSGLFPHPGMNKELMQPYIDAFTLQNIRNAAQAKESVGNLTGSSLGGVVGREMADAATQQGAWLNQFAESMRQNDANRYAQTLLGLLNSNAGGVTNVYRPGFLDYAAQGAAAFAGGGGFNSLFNRQRSGNIALPSGGGSTEGLIGFGGGWR